MRILHVVTLVDDQSSYGGPLTVAINQCRELRRRGHDARIMAGWGGETTPPEELEGVPVHLFAVRRVVPGFRFSGLFSRRMASWLAQQAKSFDVAHLHLARDLVPLSAGVQLQKAGVPYVVQTHGMIVPDHRPSKRLIDTALTLRVLRQARARFVLTDAEEAELAELLGAGGTTERLSNGVTAPAVIPTEGPTLDVLFLARLHPRKRVLDFAEAARAIIEEGYDVRFTVVGPDEGDLPALQAFIAAHPRVAGRLFYEGALPHERAVARLARASIFVLPSVDEPFPMTLLEALALGKPAICTTSCGVAKQLREDNAALVVEPGAPSIEAALRALIDDPDLRRSLSRTATSAVMARFSMAAVVNQLLAAYDHPAEVLA